MSGDRWQFWIDVGGTFTDLVALRADFMAKPFTPEAMLERVSGLLAHASEAST